MNVTPLGTGVGPTMHARRKRLDNREGRFGNALEASLILGTSLSVSQSCCNIVSRVR